ncbi:unnamed protein product [Lymnaea stagnalis]|uniref:Magnesium-dependent phosphatase 1 n=1 Tax=Lymnaea stagnalis TaxID=6523 RepID=A0AAV2HXZ5_LYMST
MSISYFGNKILLERICLRLLRANNHQALNHSCRKKYQVCINEMAEPKLIVFDLVSISTSDYTLWPFWVDTHVDPPFRMSSDGKVYDAHKQHVKYYEDVPDILSHLHRSGFQLAIASRTSAVDEASSLTRLFNWDQFFQYRQIYPGSKITHFKKLHSQSGVAYEDMLFFDDEHRNIVDVSSLGVTCMFVPEGVNKAVFQQGMQLFKKNKDKRASQ